MKTKTRRRIAQIMALFVVLSTVVMFSSYPQVADAAESFEYNLGFSRSNISNININGNVLTFDYMQVSNGGYCNNHQDAKLYFEFDKELDSKIQEIRSTFWYKKNYYNEYKRVGEKTKFEDRDVYTFGFSKISGYDVYEGSNGQLFNMSDTGESYNKVNIKVVFENGLDIRKFIGESQISNYVKTAVRTGEKTTVSSVNVTSLENISVAADYGTEARYVFKYTDIGMNIEYEVGMNAIIIDLKYRPYGGWSADWHNVLRIDPRLKERLKHFEVWRIGLNNNDHYAPKLQLGKIRLTTYASTKVRSSDPNTPHSLAKRSGIMEGTGPDLKIGDFEMDNIGYEWCDSKDGKFKELHINTKRKTTIDAVMNFNSSNTQWARIVLYLDGNLDTLLRKNDGTYKKEDVLQFENFFTYQNRYSLNSFSSNMLRIMDTDEDGLLDDFEKMIGSNYKNSDTDGDGKKDGDEFDNINDIYAKYDSVPSSYGGKNYSYQGTGINTPIPVWEESHNTFSAGTGKIEFKNIPDGWKDKALEVVLIKKNQYSDGKNYADTSIGTNDVAFVTQNDKSRAVLVTESNLKSKGGALIVNVPAGQKLETGDRLVLRLWQEGVSSDSAFSRPEISDFRIVGESTPTEIKPQYSTELKVRGTIPSGTKNLANEVKVTIGGVQIPGEYLIKTDDRNWNIDLKNEKVKALLESNGLLEERDEMNSGRGLKAGTVITAKAKQGNLKEVDSKPVTVVQGPKFNQILAGDKTVKLTASEGSSKVQFKITKKDSSTPMYVDAKYDTADKLFITNIPTEINLEVGDKVEAIVTIGGFTLQEVGTPVKGEVIENPTTGSPVDGYVRITFDPTDGGHLTGKAADGKEVELGKGIKKIFDVKKDFTWENAQAAGLYVPKAISNISDMSFRKWKDGSSFVNLPPDKAVKISETKTYTAKYVKQEQLVVDVATTGIGTSGFDWDKVIGADKKVTFTIAQYKDKDLKEPTGLANITATLQKSDIVSGKYILNIPNGMVDIEDEAGKPLYYKATSDLVPNNLFITEEKHTDTERTKFNYVIKQLINTKLDVVWNTDIENSKRPDITGIINIHGKTGELVLPKNNESTYFHKAKGIDDLDLTVDGGKLSIKGGNRQSESGNVTVYHITKDGVKWQITLTTDLDKGSKAEITQFVKVTFNGKGGNPETNVKEVLYGRNVIKTDIGQPTKEGYKFIGWANKDNIGAKNFDSIKEILEKADWVGDGRFTENTKNFTDKTVYAVWGNSKIILDPNYKGTDGQPKTGTKTMILADNYAGQDKELPDVYQKDDFNRSGYSMIGWSKDKDAQVPDTVTLNDNTSSKLVNMSKYPVPTDFINKEIKLYAVWKKNFDVTAHKIWKDNKKPQGSYEMYMALITRTAVGSFGHEVVAEAAKYYPVKDSIKKYEDGKDMTWTALPSYDNKGRRISYLVVELNAQNKDKFYSDDDWSHYGVTVVQSTGVGTADFKKGYKTQDIKINDVDAYTAATQRNHVTTTSGSTGINPDASGSVTVGEYDTIGYYINVTNTKLAVEKPTISKVYTDDTSFVLTINDEDSDKITGSIQGNEYELVKQGSVWKFTDGKGSDKYSIAADSSNPNKLNISFKDTTAKFVKAQEITAKAHTHDSITTSSEERVTVVDREESRVPTGLKQIPNVTKDGKMYTVIEATENTAIPGLGDVGSIISKKTKYTLLKENGEEVKINGEPLIAYAIQEGADKGKIKFELPHSIDNHGKAYKIKVEEPERLPKTTTDTVTVDTVGPVVKLYKDGSEVSEILIEGYVGYDIEGYYFNTDEPANVEGLEKIPIDLTYTKKEQDSASKLYKKWEIGGKSAVEVDNTKDPLIIKATDIFGNKVTGGSVAVKIKIKDKIKEPTNSETPGETPEGYIKVTFNAGDGGILSPATGNKKVYFVSKGLSMTEALAAGFKKQTASKTNTNFIGWDNEYPEKFDKDILLNAKYQDDITEVSSSIPEKEGFIRFKFLAGDGGKFTDSKAEITYEVKNTVTWNKIKEKVAALNPVKSGKNFVGWNPKLPMDTEVAKDTVTKEYTAQYGDDIIPDPTEETPEGYVRITFNAGEGSFDKDGTTVKFNSFDVKKTVNWADFAGKVVKPTPKTGENFIKWSPELPKDKTVDEGEKTFTAIYNNDIVTGDKPSDDYVKVTFSAEDKGTITGTSTYYVVKNKEVKFQSSQVPQVTGVTVGYRFKNWDNNPENPITYTVDTTIKAEYETLGNVITDDTPNEDGDKPEGYHTVWFKIDPVKGSLNGKVKFYVKPDTASREIIRPTVSANVGYKAKTGNELWSNEEIPEKITKDLTTNAQFTDLGDVIKIENPSTPPEKPEGYVKVEFKPGDRGKFDAGEVSQFYVNKTKLVTLTAPKVKAISSEWSFAGWDGNFENTQFIKEETVITAQWTNKIKEVADPEHSGEIPNGYARLVFKAGNGGYLSIDGIKVEKGIKMYDVLKDETITTLEEAGLKIPTITADDTHIVKTENGGWDKSMDKTAQLAEKTTTTYTAQYDTKTKIIEYTELPTTIEAGYVRIVFDGNGKEKTTQEVVLGNIGGNRYKVFDILKGTKYNDTYLQPKLKAVVDGKATAEGKVFDSWSDKVPLEEDKEVYSATYTAVYQEDRDVIEVTQQDAVTPAGYVTVIFDPTSEGKIGDLDFGKVKRFFVKKDLKWGKVKDKVTPPAPTHKSITQLFDKWKGETLGDEDVVAKDITYQAEYKSKDMVIIPEKQDDTVATPEGYHKVSFTGGTGGTIESTEKRIFFVLDGKTLEEAKNAEPALKVPGVKANTDNAFTGWISGEKEYGTDLADYKEAIKADVVFTAKYEDVTPVVEPTVVVDPTTTDPKTGYVRVTFKAGDNGKLKLGTVDNLNEKVYDIKEGTTLEDAKAATPKFEIPEIKPNDGFKALDTNAGWDKLMAAKFDKAEAPYIYTAQYEPISTPPVPDKPLVITDPTENMPDGYVRITFNKGANGTLRVNTNSDLSTKVYDVKQGTTKAAAELAGFIVPTIVANDDYAPKSENGGWDNPIPDTFNNSGTFTAQYVASQIKVNPDPIPADAENWVILTFDGNGGTVNGKPTTVMYVPKDMEWKDPTLDSKIKALDVKAPGKVFDAWSPAISTEDDRVTAKTFTAQYKDTVIVNQDAPTPDNYVRVIFLKGDNGTLTVNGVSGLSEYHYDVYVGEKVGSNFIIPTIIPNTDYTVNTEHGGWDKDVLTAFNMATTYVAQYTKKGTPPVPPTPPIISTITEKPTIDPVTDGDTKVTGTAKPGSSVKVILPDGTVLTATPDSDGKWAVNTPDGKPLKEGGAVTATATKPGEVESFPAQEIVKKKVEKTQPPKLDKIEDGDTKITGTAEPDSTVVITLPDGTKVTTTTDADGKFTVDVPKGTKIKAGDTVTAISNSEGKAPSDEVKKIVVKKDKPSVKPNPKEDSEEIPDRPHKPITPIYPKDEGEHIGDGQSPNGNNIINDDKNVNPIDQDKDGEASDNKGGKDDKGSDDQNGKKDSGDDANAKSEKLDGSNAWALVNLLLTIGAIILAFVLAIAKRNKEDKSGIAKVRHGKYMPIGIVVAIIAVIAFIMTEDLTQPMGMVDKYTIPMIIPVVVEAVLAYLGLKWHEETKK